jgi:type IV secretion system protein TrbJ
MKRYIVVILLTVGFASRGAAQWAVIDVANLNQSIMNYAATIEHIAKEAEQISNQVQQIKHMEDQLKRLGNMADVKAIVGFPEFKISVTLPTKIETWAKTVAKVDGTGLFGDTRGGIFQPISSDFPDFDGATISRKPEVFKPVHDITAKVDNFKDVQVDVYARRENLKKAIAATSEALQAAETEAEEKKLEAILNAQYGQLAALDSEVALSAAEIQVKAAEADAMETAQSRADAEARAKLAQKEAKKVSEAFTPTYKCLLQYVTEKPFTP